MVDADWLITSAKDLQLSALHVLTSLNSIKPTSHEQQSIVTSTDSCERSTRERSPQIRQGQVFLRNTFQIFMSF